MTRRRIPHPEVPTEVRQAFQYLVEDTGVLTDGAAGEVLVGIGVGSAPAWGTQLTGLTLLTVDNITVNGAAITSDTGAISFGDENLSTTGSITGGLLNIDNITIDGATITSDTGAISFNDENLSTTGAITGVNVTSGADPGHTHTGASLSGIDISDDTNLAVTAPITLTDDTVGLDQSGIDHGSVSGLNDDDHPQYHNDTRGDARYYTETELDGGQLDNRYYTETELDGGQLNSLYFTEAEHINSSSGSSDAGKPIVLNAVGLVDPTMVPSAASGGFADDGQVVFTEEIGLDWYEVDNSGYYIKAFSYLGNGIVLAGGGGGRVLRSTDYGENWTDLGQQHSTTYVEGLANCGSGVVVAATRAGGKVLRSTDYGATWSDLGQQHSAANLWAACFVGDDTVLIGEGSGRIFRSTDNGQNWTDLGQQFSQSIIYSLCYLGSGVVLAGTANGGLILKSSDRGATWSSKGQLGSATSVWAICYVGDGIVLAGTSPNGHIFRSTDYGENWSDLGQQASQASIEGIAYLTHGICIAGTSIGGKVLRSTDYGATWTDLGNIYSSVVYEVANAGEGTALAGSAGKIHKSGVFLTTGPADGSEVTYYLKSEYLNSSAGAGDAGKPIVLDAGGHIDATMINDADIDHDSLTGFVADEHTDAKVKVDSGATAGYIGAASNDGVLRAASPLTYTDGGDYVTLGSDALPAIKTNTTYYIATPGNGGDDTTGDGSVGSPWATLAKALTYIGDYLIGPGATVTIQLGDGTYAWSSTDVFEHQDGKRISIVGENTYSKTLSSIQSSSGSAGAWSIILNLDSVANIEVGDYAMVAYNVSGGTLPECLCGCWEVTNVDAVNTRITILSLHQHSSAPSGAVAGTVTIVKTILGYSGCTGLEIGELRALGNLNKVVFVGDKTGGTYGISVTGKAFLQLGSTVGVSSFDIGVRVLSFGHLEGDYLMSCGNDTQNLQLNFGTGRTVRGVFSGSDGTFGSIYAITSILNTYGAVVSGNTQSGVYATSSSTIGITTPAKITYNQAYGTYATINTIINASTSTFTGNGTVSSPALNTLGNIESYVIN